MRGLFGRLLRGLRSFSARMVLSHILVAALTSIFAVLVLVLLFAITIRDVRATDYRSLAMLEVLGWVYGDPGTNELLAAEGPMIPKGYGLVVSPDNKVLHAHGMTSCRAGMLLSECAPSFVDQPPGERFVEVNGERWVETILQTAGGQRVISHRGPPNTELFLSLPGAPVYGTVNFTVVVATAMAILSVPLALLFSWLWARPLGHRLSMLTQASRRFASGEFAVRVRDKHRDEVGELGRQFDDMAGALEQNVGVLRDMVQRNAELAQQAEQAAIQAERVRLSRDLHDAIAQRLFSLSVSTATLPDLIGRDQAEGVAQARTIASMAEQTLLDLRALLLDLRPSNVLQRGLADALRSLCSEWQNSYRATTDCTLMLTGRHIPAPIEDVIYRVAQEALNNVARHANPSSVQISLVEGQRQITLSVTDDGKGFDPEEEAGHGKFGLISMRERAQSVGGNIAIESDTARGTTLRMTLPREGTDIT